MLVVIVAESDWSGDASMKKYYNDTLHPHITDIAYLDKSPTEKTDLLDIVKKLVMKYSMFFRCDSISRIGI